MLMRLQGRGRHITARGLARGLQEIVKIGLGHENFQVQLSIDKAMDRGVLLDLPCPALPSPTVGATKVPPPQLVRFYNPLINPW